MVTESEKSIVKTRTRSVRKGPLVFTILAAVLIMTSVSFILSNSGSTSAAVTPAKGMPANGAVASIDTSIATAVTRSEGMAQLQTGVVLARIEVTPSFATKLRVNVFWTDPYDAGKALSNPNAQISVGLYYPIHSGPCNYQPASTVATYVTVTDGATNNNPNTYCSALDTSAGGSANVSAQGKLLITRHLPGGYLFPTVADSGLYGCPLPPPTGTAETGITWCEPSAIAGGSLATPGPGVLYVVASVLTPGGAPIGQQSTLNSLSFFINATA